MKQKGLHWAPQVQLRLGRRLWPRPGVSSVSSQVQLLVTQKCLCADTVPGRRADHGPHLPPTTQQELPVPSNSLFRQLLFVVGQAEGDPCKGTWPFESRLERNIISEQALESLTQMSHFPGTVWRRAGHRTRVWSTTQEEGVGSVAGRISFLMKREKTGHLHPFSGGDFLVPRDSHKCRSQLAATESPEPKSTRGHGSGRTGVAVMSPSPALPGAALPLTWETVFLGVQPAAPPAPCSPPEPGRSLCRVHC